MPKSFEIGDEAMEALRDLWPVFDVRSDSDALRKSIALARVVARYVDASGNITVRQGENEMIVALRD